MAQDKSSEEITHLLAAWGRGDQAAGDKLTPLVYERMQRMARRFLSDERRNHTLQPTALVHEAYLRLVDQDDLAWESRRHFFAIAATMMRRILLDHARSRSYAKRGGGQPAVALETAMDLAVERPKALLAVDDALEDFRRLDPEKAALIELRFFAGLSLLEAAEALGCSRSTVDRQWRVARAWLRQQLLHAGC